MLSFEDCVAMSEFTEEELGVIAHHEHVPLIVAAELARFLVHDAAGVPRLSRMFRDALDEARARGDAAESARLKRLLRHFLAAHPAKPAKPACCGACTGACG